MKNVIYFLLSIVAFGCSSNEKKCVMPPYQAVHVAYQTAVAQNGDTICFGGYGSAMAYDSNDSTFYLLTDRGPNVDGKTAESKMFPFPKFSPTIGKFKRVGDSLLLVKNIVLKEGDGTPFLGLPNRKGDGVTGEVAYDIAGNVITGEFRGLDTEGLALAPDGTFWVSDEYAPFVMQFSAEGFLLREMAPGKGLPTHFHNRRPNRGMEGLTISADGTKLYGIMQSPLYLPDSRTKNVSVNNRILEIDIQSGATREFIYTLEDPALAVSEICFVNDSTMLVLERDGKFTTSPEEGFKSIFKINIASATDVSNIEMEMMSSDELKQQGVAAVTKELYVNILEAIPGYSHDKAEGLALVDGKLAIINDDDFAVVETEDGGFIPKINAQGVVDHSTLYIVEL